MNRSFITYYFFHSPQYSIFRLSFASPLAFHYLLIRQDAVRDSQSKNFVFHLPLHSPFLIFEAGNHHIFILKS